MSQIKDPEDPEQEGATDAIGRTCCWISVLHRGDTSACSAEDNVDQDTGNEFRPSGKRKQRAAWSVRKSLSKVTTEGKPSQILYRLRALDDGRCDDEVMRSIFLEQMPEMVKTILVAAKVAKLQDLAELADKIFESTAQSSHVVASIDVRDRSNRDSMEAKLDKLTDAVLKMSASFERLEEAMSRSKSRQRGFAGRSSERSRAAPTLTPAVCWAHSKFGAKAYACKDPENSRNCKPVASGLRLYAANNTRVDTYGESTRTIEIGLRRPITWNFCVADVPYPNVGADLLTHYGITVDLRGRKIIDALTKLQIWCTTKNVNHVLTHTVDRSSGIAGILLEFSEVTGISQAVPLQERGVFHYIQTKGHPVASRARRLAPGKLRAAKLEFRHLMEAGSPKKMGNGELNLHKKTVFSCLDIHQAYQQIPVAPEDVPKTAVITPFGLFEYLAMPFGLRNAGQTFQWYMNRALGDLEFAFVYVDDILIASASREEHIAHTRTVLERLNKFHLKINVEKCQFGVPKLTFLGHLINREGYKPTPGKIDAIQNFDKPKTIVELRRFLGIINFYRRSIPHAATLQAPLNAYLTQSRRKDKTKINWSVEAEESFRKVKESLVNATLIAHPSGHAVTRVVTDSSEFAMGAVLEQKLEDMWKPLAFYSKKFNPAQQRYSTYDRELTAAYSAVKQFKHFLEGREFKIVTDHKPLIYAFMQRADKADPRQVRMLSYISQFTTQIEFLPGVDNIVADSMSRIESIRLPTDIELCELAQAQENDDELERIRDEVNHPLKLVRLMWGPAHTRLYCEQSGETVRPYIPSALRKKVFHLFHALSHPSAKLPIPSVQQNKSCKRLASMQVFQVFVVYYNHASTLED
ncbi:uncharacterized protein LOC122403181 [Colletes gigas]|uniref:uncharacterized protein LOC122403181 n=1 Tax=Colletes gigas TaxID=935657 RepID=UPI001C9A6151|nr:uncharacterized protein LOC122403181 [Colletes gigas]